jgi:hypothetical protein
MDLISMLGGFLRLANIVAASEVKSTPAGMFPRGREDRMSGPSETVDPTNPRAATRFPITQLTRSQLLRHWFASHRAGVSEDRANTLAE